MILVLLGAPGSGKGTLAQALQTQRVARQISTGDLFRREIAAGTPLGKKIKEDLDAGRLMSDEETLALVAKEINDDVILDGYPRNLKQAGDLEDLLSKRNKKIDLVINLFADEPTIIDRIINRVICSKCHAIFNTKYSPPRKTGICDVCGGELVHRKEDDATIIARRIAIYEEKTKPLLKHYKQLCPMLEVDSRRENAIEYVKSHLAKLNLKSVQ